ncbi:MAG: hypothetical protein AAF485_06145 [Chloroflexota bacterium]
MSAPPPGTEYTIPNVGNNSFTIDYITIDNHAHRVAYAGNPEGTPVILMMGVFEDSLRDARWLVSEMINHPNGSNYRFIIVNVPFLEEYTEIRIQAEVKAKFDGFIPPNRTVPQKGILAVDPRFDLENCAYTLRAILKDGLEIEKAHFVGHDRGCIIMDNMLGEFPEMALSYSRGSQGWTHFQEEWFALVNEGTFLGPPHNIMRTDKFQPFLRNALRGGFPFYFSAPAFAKKASIAAADTELGQRWAAFQSMANQSPRFFELTRQMFRQTDFKYERERRIDSDNPKSILKTTFPLMQFQGSEEMVRAQDIPGAKKMSLLRKLKGLFGGGSVTGIARLGRLRFPTYEYADLPGDFGILSNHIGDQPYFGVWNFFADEVEDLLPGGTWQDRNSPVWQENYKKYVTVQAGGNYATLQTKKNARMTRFAIISDSTHWQHFENPAGMAWACLDFIGEAC